jgi:hypothetical protein
VEREEVVVGFLKRIFGGAASTGEREFVAQEVREMTTQDDDELIEVSVVGESHRQDALAGIAGPKDEWGKRKHVGATLRCEPRNEYDSNAVRVEVMGQHVGYVGRDHARLLSPALQRTSGGVIEATGVVVGGWSRQERDSEGRYADGTSEGHYGVRVWLTRPGLKRLDVPPRALDPEYRPRFPAPPPIAPGERRLSPSRSDFGQQDYGSQVTVTCEEHYQETIEASMPEDWEPDCSWPVLVDLLIADGNPHSKSNAACVETRIGDSTVGYFTSKMTDRHRAAIAACIGEDKRATATATVSRGTKSGQDIWRLRVLMPDVSSSESPPGA